MYTFVFEQQVYAIILLYELKNIGEGVEIADCYVIIINVSGSLIE